MCRTEEVVALLQSQRRRPHLIEDCTLTSHLIWTTSDLWHARRQQTSPLSFLALSSAFLRSSPPGMPRHVPLTMWRSTASFGSRAPVVSTTSWHMGHWGAMRSTMEGGRGAVHACAEGRKCGWQYDWWHAGHWGGQRGYRVRRGEGRGAEGEGGLTLKGRKSFRWQAGWWHSLPRKRSSCLLLGSARAVMVGRMEVAKE